MDGRYDKASSNPNTRQWCFRLHGKEKTFDPTTLSDSADRPATASNEKDDGQEQIRVSNCSQASFLWCDVDLIFLAWIPAAACSDLAWSWPSLWAVAVPQRIYQQVASLDCAFLHPFSSLLFVPFSLFCWWCRSKCGWNQSFLAVAEQQLSASFHTTILLLPICHGVRTGTSSWTENVRNDRTFGWWASPSNQNEPPPNGWFLLDMDVSSEFWRNMPSVFNSMRKQAARKIS